MRRWRRPMECESRKRLAGEEIDVGRILTKPGFGTGIATMMVNSHGENIIGVVSGANGQLTPEYITGARTVFDGASMAVLQVEIPVATTIRASELACERGCPVLLNPSPMPGTGIPKELISRLSIPTPREGELLAMLPDTRSAGDAVAKALGAGTQIAVATQGRNGANAPKQLDAYSGGGGAGYRYGWRWRLFYGSAGCLPRGSETVSGGDQVRRGRGGTEHDCCLRVGLAS